jgi:predicted nucleic acid-binding protein
VSRKHERIVALATMALAWGIRKKGSKENIKRARYLFNELEQDDAQIVVPSVVVAEYIAAIADQPERDQTVAEMSVRFILAPFDQRDALLAAQLWRDGKSKRELGSKGSRVCLRADVMIVATAVGHGAREFYTNDTDCLKMAKKVIDARPLPEMGANLFDDVSGD